MPFMDSSSSSLCCTLTRTLVTPIDDMESSTLEVMALPSVMMAITAAIPMMMPSIVRSARILLAFRLNNANRMFS